MHHPALGNTYAYVQCTWNISRAPAATAISTSEIADTPQTPQPKKGTAGYRGKQTEQTVT